MPGVRHVSGASAERKTERRAENLVEWSGAVNGCGRKRWSGSGAWSGRSPFAERERNRKLAESADYSPLQPNILLTL